ncbi:MAG TPA: hypothetical protein DEG17_21065 [Cyanobacteria bacterium UBA11149]|nr:hypothetical protein [Cyanobacteria bacterium UBA11367]HBE60362.1 hypothetical protein [Cyanobacteria bacterium UBA11366]HBR74588.1 hypothetical protein [Cyanobacteria bacterium UBA11159]HBS71590.1 hypothetical protein [Cyanobacteria bacterium UBA11153]HBW91281.1 hypothetical protein [Cyanobacteria bacterium UBA11149]HCA95385.1 hypothetical protein [Cyanobacteria bacterium UBA9226]
MRKIRERCPHFDKWISQLETLTQSSSSQ